MENVKSTQRQGIQVIGRAAAILRVLEAYPEGLSLGEIAKIVDLARSTVQRIVAALVEERFLISATPNSRVRLGPGLVSLGAAAKQDLDKVVHPYLEQLSEEVNETVDLSLFDKNVAVFVDQIVDMTQRLQAISQVGMTFPLHCSANGKAMLAALPDDQVASLLEDKLSAYTKNTIISKRKLKVELDNIREKGYAIDNEEHSDGVSAVGAIVEDPFGRLLAVSIPVPTIRFNKREKTLVTALKKYIGLIEKALG